MHIQLGQIEKFSNKTEAEKRLVTAALRLGASGAAPALKAESPASIA